MNKKEKKKLKKKYNISMGKKYKIPLIIIFILLVVSISLLVIKYCFYNNTKNEPTVYSSILDNMESYGYTLDDQDSKLFKDKYYDLKKILESDEIDYDAYGKCLSELFIIDLYTLSTKINKFDVGGVEYVYDNEKEMFKNKVMDTLYETLEDNSYGTRKQELPTVKELVLEKEDEVTYQIDNKKLKGTKYTYNVEYEKDLGYSKKSEITVVKDDNKMYIVEFISQEK